MIFDSRINKNDLKVIKLKDCIKKISTGLNPRDNFSLGSGDIKYITAKNLTQAGYIDFSTCDYVDIKAKEIINKRSDIQKGDILFSSRAPIGHCHLIKENPDYYDIGESIFSIRIDDNIILPEYLCLYLSSDLFVNLASNNVTGSIIKEIRIADLLDTEIIVPPKDYQRKVAKYIGTLDEKIELNKLISNEIEESSKLLYDYWFVQFDFPNEIGKPYKSSGGKMVWNEELKRNVPDGWKVVPTLEVLNWISTSQPPKSSFIYEPKEGYIRFIQNRDYDGDEHLTYIPFTSGTKTCTELDIMMDKYGDAGKTRYGISGAFNVALAKIEVKDSKYKEYLRAFLSSKPIYNYLHDSCIASTRASLNENNLSYLYVPIPNNELLEKYNKIAINNINMLLNLGNENERLVNIRDCLLPLFIRGMISIKE